MTQVELGHIPEPGACRTGVADHDRNVTAASEASRLLEAAMSHGVPARIGSPAPSAEPTASDHVHDPSVAAAPSAAFLFARGRVPGPEWVRLTAASCWIGEGEAVLEGTGAGMDRVGVE